MRRLALLVAAFVVLAGCNAPGVTDTPAPGTPSPSGATGTPAGTATGATATESAATATTTTPTIETATPTPPQSPEQLASRYEFEPEGGELPFDARLTFARTALLLDRPNADPPVTVVVQPREDVTFRTQFGDFFRTLRIAPPPEEAVFPAFTNGRTITMSAGLADRPAFAEATFAQESAHVIQFGADADEKLRRAIVTGQPTVDELQVIRAVFEGAAVYTESVYQRQYLDRNRTRIDTLRARYLNSTGVARISFGLYYFGARYVERRVDDPAETWGIYDDPPRTTEQLLHGDAEPARELTVTADTERYEELSAARTTMGELFLRTTLATNLSDTVAARGADGWGTDRRLAFTVAGERRPSAYAWVHRWDDRRNATEFLGTVRAYLNETATRRVETVGGERRVVWTADGDRYRLVRVAPETTVLLMGDPAFVRNATVAGANASVQLTVNASTASSEAVSLPSSARESAGTGDATGASLGAESGGGASLGGESVGVRVAR